MHSAPIMNSRFAEGTLLRTDGFLLGWEKRSYSGSFPAPTMASSAPPAPAQTHESPGGGPGASPERPAPGEPIPQPQQPGCPGKRPGLGGEHRWRPLCPSEAEPGAAGGRLPDNGHGHCGGARGAWWLCVKP